MAYNKPDKKDEGDCWDKKNKKNCGPEKEPDLWSKLTSGRFRFSFLYFILVLFGLSIVNTLFVRSPEIEIGFSEFKERISIGEIKSVRLSKTYYYGTSSTTQRQGSTPAQPTVYRTVPVEDPGFIEFLDKNNVEYAAQDERTRNLIAVLLNWFIPIIFLILIWRFMFKKMGNMNSNVLSFGQNKARLIAENDTGTRFEDVAGVDEAKEELVEIVDFLKNPRKYTAIGGKIPKGILLIGPPGTGKTLIARAVAGEAEVTFFRMSGADFVEMFVGVGAARVRDLFRQAREKAPCIIFIDELDAIGKSRANAMGGNDEREQTLNQLLVEMDGFDATSGVIILAATNRPEILDPALLRPGRFDRQVLVDRPDLHGREAILKIHAKNVKLDPSVKLSEIARSSPGFVGSDLANVINEAALLAVRNGRELVTMEDLHEAIEKAVAGLKKKNRLINKREREIVAYHETGHALAAAMTENSDPVQKISIVPRGLGALGYTLQMPVEDRFLMTEDELLGRIDVLLGGRAAEQLIYGKISTGAANDLVKAADIAKNMITEYGMSEKFSNVALQKKPHTYLGNEVASSREYSEKTQQYIDEEIARIISESYARVKISLKQKEDLLRKIAGILLEKEVIEAKEFLAILKEAEDGIEADTQSLPV